MKSLFEQSGKTTAPLAEQLRPQTIEEVVGQQDGISGNALLRELIAGEASVSLQLSGPASCRKTTLARIIDREMDPIQETITAVSSGVADMKKIFETARK